MRSIKRFFKKSVNCKLKNVNPLLRTLLECSASNFVLWYLYFVGEKKWSQELRKWSQKNELNWYFKNFSLLRLREMRWDNKWELKFCIRVNHFTFIAHRDPMFNLRATCSAHLRSPCLIACRVYQLCNTKLPCLRVSRYHETELKLGVTRLKIASGKE